MQYPGVFRTVPPNRGEEKDGDRTKDQETADQPEPDAGRACRPYRTLKKLHIKVNVPAVVVASLCHDLGMLGRYEKFSSGKECSREHPKESVAVARELVSDLPEKTEDIIERHMWPMGQAKAPNSIEGIVVSVADKYNAVKDLVKGSEVNHTGVKNYVHEKGKKIQQHIHEKQLR